MLDAVVIGAGIAGLTAAYRLHHQGKRVLLIDSQSQPGGVIQTEIQDGFMLELGPNSFQRSASEILTLAHELGLEPMGASSVAKKRYLYLNHRLEALPTNPVQMVTSPFLPLRGKLRMLQEPMIAPKSDGIEETVAQFVERRLGRDVLDNLFAPFVSGIYAGNPAQMSMKASFPRLVEWEQTGGSIIKGMLASRKSKKSQPPPPYERPKSALLSFEQGMAALPMALFHSLPKTACQLGASVTSIQKVDTGYSIQVDNQPQSIETRTLILATPAYATQSLLGTMPGGDSLSLLLDIPYAAIHAVHVGLPKRALPHPLDGFGYLIPRTQGITLLGSIWSSSLFPNRAPQGMALLTNFIGGMHYPEIAHWRPAQVEQQVLSDLARIFKVNDLNPSLVKVTAWPRAIPQYTLGHVERVSQLESVVTSTLPGVFLTGNYLRGVSVNDTIKAARACVDKALDFMGDKATSAYALFS